MEIPELPLPLCEINTAQKTESEGEGTGRKTDPFSDAFPGVSLFVTVFKHTVLLPQL